MESEYLTNARDELLEVLQSHGVALDEILCAMVGHEVETEEPDPETGSYFVTLHTQLPLGHDAATRDAFFESLNFEYYAGYGAQTVFGTVWLTQHRWVERNEYDGSEWWEFRSFPPIPERLNA